jgi:hypothetical protein
MTEADARALLRDWPGVGGLEAWIAGRRWQAVSHRIACGGPLFQSLRAYLNWGTIVTLDAPHVLAMGAGALMLVCVSFLEGLNSVVMWTLRLLAWVMIATVILTSQ